MKSSYHAVRSLVKRPAADEYLLITLLSFAASVSLTRLYLELADYPQLGNDTLHIAHVLWGGLLLFVAALLPLIFANRWVYQMSALLAGAGMGLFIDEIGKFITQTNDYFYQPAAPLIYAIFLITVLVYIQTGRSRPRHPRSELYAALEHLEEVIDHDLDERERGKMEEHLRFTAEQVDDPELARLSGELLAFVSNPELRLAPLPPDRLIKFRSRFGQVYSRHLDHTRTRIVLAACLGALGLGSIINSMRMITPNLFPGPQEYTIFYTLEIGSQTRYAYAYWFLILSLFQALTGAVLMAGSVLAMRNRERAGFTLCYLALIVDLTVLDILRFYYFQFSTVLFALFQFILLLALISYRRQFKLLQYNKGGVP